MRLDQFAAPYFSGLAFSMGIVLVELGHWPTAIFCLASALGYWSRMTYLYWKEVRAA